VNREIGVDDFDGDRPVQGGVPGEEHDAHAPVTKLPLE
jgi:hypothetical protein